ncbi:hypothetical protein [Enterobacter sp. Bisph1]|uniref:T6SS effector phospholipase Tle3 domain-containing protein n=1 Tax=Enterobacter sp. Bisph1 TaxID=1274399 RepID=UPI00068C4CFC|nr:hypothetical protein [Enterobacter sp. Bisph1]
MSEPSDEQTVNPFDEIPQAPDPQSYGVHNKRMLASQCIGVPVTAGKKMYTTNCPVHRPMPGIVILVHGVNDVGEAYSNQERGIIEGLKKRLGRDDLWPHTWDEKLYKIRYNAEDNTSNGITDKRQKQMVRKDHARSPVIPFYWGYRPVDHELWDADQREYREKMRSNYRSPATPLPYDAYREINKKVIAQFGNEAIDNFHNWLDPNGVKGGGTFANATTSIPDMLGPGANGLMLYLTGIASRSATLNKGDLTHPVYSNPHRIYQFYAAQRLANLIIKIRDNRPTQNDTINIVAHSQGTIVTMLANMIVKQEGRDPADCTILNHSPYSLECRLLEEGQPGHQQTDEARQQTFKNFCHLMAQNKRYDASPVAVVSSEEQQIMLNEMTLPRRELNSAWYDSPLNQRNNCGLVYNYFCPNDATVSLWPIQGFGWRGIPENIASTIPNLRQRVFYQNSEVGNAPDGKPFRLPRKEIEDYWYSPVVNAPWNYYDVVVNGAELPEKFVFTLMGQPDLTKPETQARPYQGKVSGNDVHIQKSTRAANASERDKMVFERHPLPRIPKYISLPFGHELTDEEITELRNFYRVDFRKGRVSGTKEKPMMEVWRKKSDIELEKEFSAENFLTYSQHSSIVMSDKAPELAMAYDLAVGTCRSFDYQHGNFWNELLELADWRSWQTDSDTYTYYRTGQLPFADTKIYMNRPDEVLPTGEFGVVNEYGMPKNAVQPSPRNRWEIETGAVPPHSMTAIPVLQWDMPPVASFETVPAQAPLTKRNA